MVGVSDEARVAFAPASTYRTLLADDVRVTWFRAFARPAFVALLIGTAVSIAAVGRVSIGLVASAAVSWSFAVGLQMALGVILIASSPARRIGMPRALDLWFAGHLPWSLWLLGAAAAVRIVPSLSIEPLLLTMILPLVWTWAIASAFCRSVLGATRGRARLSTAAHQTVIVLLVLGFIAWSAGGWFRLVS